MDVAARLAWMRRYARLSWVLGVVFFAALPLVDLVLGGSYRAPQLVAGGVALAAVTVQHARILHRALDGLAGFGRVELAASFLVALGGWLLMAPAARPEVRFVWAMLPAAIVGACAVGAPPGRRARAVLGGTGVVAAAGAVLSWLSGVPGSVALTGAMVTGVYAALSVQQHLLWSLTLELDRARQAEADLAVARERLRFAADLHDIQGHHLQAIFLKGELVTRLIGGDDAAARQHAADIQALAGAALADTRRVVGGYRAVSLDVEIDNAVGILAAGGIDATVRGDPAAVPEHARRLLGLLVREGTTNLLRHVGGGRCTIEVRTDPGQVVVHMHSQGTRPGAPQPDGSGLAGLRERFTAAGGCVDAGWRADEFVLTGRVPA